MADIDFTSQVQSNGLINSAAAEAWVSSIRVLMTHETHGFPPHARASPSTLYDSYRDTIQIKKHFVEIRAQQLHWCTYATNIRCAAHSAISIKVGSTDLWLGNGGDSLSKNQIHTAAVATPDRSSSFCLTQSEQCCGTGTVLYDTTTAS